MCHPANNKSVSFIFVHIQKATNTLNLLTNPIYQIYVFCFSYHIVNLFFIGKWILTYKGGLFPLIRDVTTIEKQLDGEKEIGAEKEYYRVFYIKY